MSRFLDEMVFSMPPIAMAAIEELGEALLTALAPNVLSQPTQLDVLHLVENVLPQVNIHIYPARAVELGEREGATDPQGDREIDILIAEDLWRDLYGGGRQGRRARATIAHEVSHAVLHVPVVRRRLASPHRDLLLARVRRGSIPAYRDPEWQAWALAGCILMPRRTVKMLPDRSLSSLAHIYGVSEEFAQSHLRRLKVEVVE